MKFELEQFSRNTPDEELISDLKRVAKKLNTKSVTQDQYNDNGHFHSTTQTRRFGSWFNVLDLAGLDQTRTPMNIPDDHLFKNIEEMWLRLGRQPRYADVIKPFSKYSVGTYEKRFGGWSLALGKFSDYINNETNNTELPTLKSSSKYTTKRRTSRTINLRLRFTVMKRDDFKCKSCGRSPATDPSVILHIDHIQAWANDGETVLGNLQTLCSICNIGKSDT